MSEVNRPFEIFRVSVPDGEYSRRADVVEKLHYDAVKNQLDRLEVKNSNQFETITSNQDQLAALREELARYKSLFEQAQKTIDRVTELKQKKVAEISERTVIAEHRLADAERRNSELVQLLRELDDNWNSHDGRERFSLAMRKVEAALTKPEEAKS